MEKPTKNVEKKENSIEVKMIFNSEMEVKRVNDTIKKIPWMREQGYDEVNSRLPKDVTEYSSPEEIEAGVNAEFGIEKYEDFSYFIEEQWPLIERGLNELKEIPVFHLFDIYTVELTQYGSGGSYYAATGKVILNIEDRSPERIVGILSHEIVHIGVEHLITKYNIPHWYKERLVDLIGAKYFPEFRNIQRPKEEDLLVVNEAFEKCFPDLEAVAREIGEKKN